MAESTLIVRSLSRLETKEVLKSAFRLGRENYLVFICFGLAQLIATQLLMLIPMVGFLALVFIQAFFTITYVGAVEALVRNKRRPELKDLGFPYLHTDIVQKILPVQAVLFAVVLLPIILIGLGLIAYVMMNPGVSLNENFIYVGAALGIAYAAIFNLAGYLFYYGVLLVLQHKMTTNQAFRGAFRVFLKNWPIFLFLDLITIIPAAVGMGLVTIASNASAIIGSAVMKGVLGAVGLLISPFFTSICYLVYRKAVTPPSPEPAPIIS